MAAMMRDRGAGIAPFLLVAMLLAAFGTRDARGAAVGPVTVTSLEREVDLSSSNMAIATTLKVAAGKAPLEGLRYCFGEIVEGRALMWIAFEQVGKGPTKSLSWRFDSSDPGCALVDLATAVPSGGETTVEVFEVRELNLVPVPEQIGQNEPQIMKLARFDVVVSHPDLVVGKQVTRVQFPTGKVKHYTRASIAKINRVGGMNELVYGPFQGQAPRGEASLVDLIYEQPEPQLVVESVVRNVTVSLWGNIHVEEHYHVMNAGPPLRDGFSRVDYNRNPSQHIVHDMTLRLPKGAFGTTYKDRLGNITTSSSRYDVDGVDVKIRPRFPIAGGWQSHFHFGYKLKPQEYLSQGSNGKTILKLDLMPAIEGVPIRQLVINAAVPEFATGVSAGPISGSALFTPDDPIRRYTYSSSTTLSYFDLFGRPVRTMAFENVGYPESIAIFYVQYKIGAVYAIKEPILLTVFAAALGAALFAALRFK